MTDSIIEISFWDNVPTEIKQAIKQAKDELDPGEGTPHSQVMEEMKNQFLNK